MIDLIWYQGGSWIPRCLWSEAKPNDDKPSGGMGRRVKYIIVVLVNHTH